MGTNFLSPISSELEKEKTTIECCSSSLFLQEKKDRRRKKGRENVQGSIMF